MEGILSTEIQRSSNKRKSDCSVEELMEQLNLNRFSVKRPKQFKKEISLNSLLIRRIRKSKDCRSKSPIYNATVKQTENHYLRMTCEEQSNILYNWADQKLLERRFLIRKTSALKIAERKHHNFGQNLGNFTDLPSSICPKDNFTFGQEECVMDELFFNSD